MRRALPSLPVFVQVGLLVVLSIVAALVVAFALLLHAPPPAAPGFTLDQAVDALSGRPVRAADGESLNLHLTVTDASPLPEDSLDDPLAAGIAQALRARLELGPDAVRVRVQQARTQGAAWSHAATTVRGTDGGGALTVTDRETATRTIVIRRPSAPPAPPAPPTAGAPTPPPAPPAPPEPIVLTDDIIGPGGPRITVFAEQVRFPPFTASVLRPDGRWATVSPPMGLWSPWHTRILLSFLASLALLAPLAWWIARGLTRPIRAFAQAAERLGADPHAPPLAETGPSEVRHAAHAFNEMQAKLNRYVEGRTQMVAAIAHDLRTPLTRLRFRAEQAEPEVRDRLAADIEQMDRMIGQALAYVRGETIRDARVALDLGALTASVVDDLAEIGADATVEAADGIQVEGESLNLRRAIGNLVENAIKFAGSASVAVTTEGGVAVVAVSDTGPGLPEGELDSVFEPFQRGEKSRNRETGGTGLGLAVARGIARAHGGDVVLSNRPEGGLTARLTLPLLEPRADR